MVGRAGAGEHDVYGVGVGEGRCGGAGEPDCGQFGQGAGELSAAGADGGVEAVQLHDEDGRDCQGDVGEPDSAERGAAGNGVGAGAFGVSADVQEPCERESRGPDGVAGRNASGVPALSRRKLPGGQYDCRSLRLEEDDWADCGPAGTREPVEIPFDRRAGTAGVSGVVRRLEDAAGVGGVCGLLAGRRACGTGARPGAVCAGRAGRD